MAHIKCKMCGGNIELSSNSTVAECSFCGTVQTVPTFSDDKKLKLHNKANALRIKNEFDKAIITYDIIIDEDDKDAEAHWGIVLSKYGIEYVDDLSGIKVPTCHRTLYKSIFDDENYQYAIKYSDVLSREIYQKEAEKINKIQKDIISVSQKEEPYDIFICYKEKDEAGNRKIDSVIAQEVYDELNKIGYKVFFSRITLEDKIGTLYEPHIFAALNTAKVMIIIGTNPNDYEAPWVKNEWSRFLHIMEESNEKKYVIPCYKDFDVYDLPNELIVFQAQDINSIGFIQDLVRGINKLFSKTDKKESYKEALNIDSLLDRCEILIKDRIYDKASELLEIVLNNDPKNARAYVYLLLIELGFLKEEDLKESKIPLENNQNYKYAYSFADKKYKIVLTEYNECSKIVIENERLEKIYQQAIESASRGKYKDAISDLSSIKEYRDAEELIEDYQKQNKILLQKKEVTKKVINKIKIIYFPIFVCIVVLFILTFTTFIPLGKYYKAINYLNEGEYTKAIEIFEENIDYKDANKYYLIAKTSQCFVENNYEAAIDFIYELGGTVDVTYNPNGGITSKEGETIKKIAYISNDAVKDGYDFAGWKVKTFNINYETYYTSVVLKAEWTPTRYIITYHNISDIDNLPSFYTCEDTIILSSINKSGYIFIGWQEKGNVEIKDEIIIPEGSTGDKEFYAIFETKKFNVVLDVNGGEELEKINYLVQYNTINQFPTPTKFGYTFVGWFHNDVLVGDKWLIEGDVTLVAKWELTHFNIKYNLNGSDGSLLPDSYTIYDEFVFPSLSKTGYTFVGWKINDSVNSSFMINKGSSGNIELTAVFTANKYSIQIELKDDEKLDGTVTRYEVYYDNKITLPIPSKNGYRFIGYEYNGTMISSDKWNIASDAVITCKWEIKNYKLELDLVGGTINQYIPVTYTINDEITLPIPVKTEYEFIGWKDIDTGVVNYLVTIPKGMTGDKKYEAVYEGELYLLVFNANNGQENKQFEFGYGESLSAIKGSIKNPMKDYCEFLGWDCEIPDTMPANNVTINAIWYNLKDNFLFSGSTVEKYFGDDRYVRIPDSYTVGGVEYKIKTMGYDVISYQTIKELYIGKYIEELDISCFVGCTELEYIYVNEDNLSYKSIDGNLYDKNGKTLLQYCKSKKDKVFIAPDGLEVVPNLALIEVKYLEEIVFKEGLEFLCILDDNCKIKRIYLPTTIKDLFFYGSSSEYLYQIDLYYAGTIEQWCTIVTSTDYHGCPSYGRFYLLNEDGEYEEVTEIVIPDTIKYIRYGLFNFPYVTKIILSENVKMIDDEAFIFCTNLKEIYIPSTLHTMGSNIFSFSNQVIIYTDASTKPSGWDANWNSTNRPVIWNSSIDALN